MNIDVYVNIYIHVYIHVYKCITWLCKIWEWLEKYLG